MAVLITALLIIAAIAAGLFAFYLVTITFTWLKNKIAIKSAEKRVKSVVVADMENIIINSNNKISLDELNNITGGRRSVVIAGVDENNRIVGNVEIDTDKNDYLDPDVQELLGREKTVVVECN
ncbi:MAG: hypothetical protein SO206_03755 [Bacilli bacterium]|nr:hypothetical protein [Bacilli bacterium]